MVSGTRTARQLGAILHAPGEGHRMELRPKVLMEDGGRLTLVVRIANVLITGGCPLPVVVIGANADTTHRTDDLADCVVIRNPEWRTGRGISFLRGIRAAPAGVPTIVALVYQPGFSAELMQRLIGGHFQGRVGTGRGIEISARLPSGRVTAVAYVDSTGRLRRGYPVVLDPDAAYDVSLKTDGDSRACKFLAYSPDLGDLVDYSDFSDGAISICPPISSV